MNKRHVTLLIAVLWLGLTVPAMAGHQAAPVDYAAEHLARTADQWRATTHYLDGRSRQAWLAVNLSQATRGFNEQLRYRQPFERVWASWEILAAQFFQARELKHQLAHRHGTGIVRQTAFPYQLSQHQSHGSAYRPMAYGSGYKASYQVALESWRRMANAFYELHDAMRLERDRYYARHQGYRKAPGYGSRGDSLKDSYYRR